MNESILSYRLLPNNKKSKKKRGVKRKGERMEGRGRGGGRDQENEKEKER